GTSATLAAILGAAERVGSERTRVLGLQDRVVDEMARCDEALADIARARGELAGPLFGRDGRPLWDPQAKALVAGASGRLRAALDDTVELSTRYLGGPGPRVPVQAV